MFKFIKIKKKKKKNGTLVGSFHAACPGYGLVTAQLFLTKTQLYLATQPQVLSKSALVLAAASVLFERASGKISYGMVESGYFNSKQCMTIARKPQVMSKFFSCLLFKKQVFHPII